MQNKGFKFTGKSLCFVKVDNFFLAVLFFEIHTLSSRVLCSKLTGAGTRDPASNKNPAFISSHLMLGPLVCQLDI